MATRTDFTPEEWTQLKNAPMNAAMYIVTASPSGPVGLVKELAAVATAVADLQKDAGAPPLLKELFPAGEGEEKAESKEVSEGDKNPDQRTALLAGLKDTLAVLDARAGGDAAAIKQWIYGVAEKVAGTAKEGGFLGIGGKPLSAEEQAALDELKVALGV